MTLLNATSITLYFSLADMLLQQRRITLSMCKIKMSKLYYSIHLNYITRKYHKTSGRFVVTTLDHNVIQIGDQNVIGKHYNVTSFITLMMFRQMLGQNDIRMWPISTISRNYDIS